MFRYLTNLASIVPYDSYDEDHNFIESGYEIHRIAIYGNPETIGETHNNSFRSIEEAKLYCDLRNLEVLDYKQFRKIRDEEWKKWKFKQMT